VVSDEGGRKDITSGDGREATEAGRLTTTGHREISKGLGALHGRFHFAFNGLAGALSSNIGSLSRDSYFSSDVISVLTELSHVSKSKAMGRKHRL
jgi:hypothetical protein